jgi:hypothetical protein
MMSSLDGPDYQEFICEDGVLVPYIEWRTRHPLSATQIAANRAEALRMYGGARYHEN